MLNRNFCVQQRYRATHHTPKTQSNFTPHRKRECGEKKKKKKKKTGRSGGGGGGGGRVAAAVAYRWYYYMLYYIILYCSRIPVAVFVCFWIGFSAW